jgi:hypothetical protein
MSLANELLGVPYGTATYATALTVLSGFNVPSYLTGHSNLSCTVLEFLLRGAYC